MGALQHTRAVARAVPGSIGLPDEARDHLVLRDPGPLGPRGLPLPDGGVDLGILQQPMALRMRGRPRVPRPPCSRAGLQIKEILLDKAAPFSSQRHLEVSAMRFC